MSNNKSTNLTKTNNFSKKESITNFRKSSVNMTSTLSTLNNTNYKSLTESVSQANLENFYYNKGTFNLPKYVLNNKLKHKVDIKAIIFDFDKTISENDV